MKDQSVLVFMDTFLKSIDRISHCYASYQLKDSNGRPFKVYATSLEDAFKEALATESYNWE